MCGLTESEGASGTRYRGSSGNVIFFRLFGVILNARDLIGCHFIILKMNVRTYVAWLLAASIHAA